MAIDDNFFPTLIGGVVALKIVDSLDKPKAKTVTKVVYVKNGKPVKVVKKPKHHHSNHGPFHLNVPSIFK